MDLIKDKQVQIIEHMTGCTRWKNKSSHGFRNYFCAEVGSEDYNSLIDMVDLGLVVSGYKINEDKDQYFHATLKGCEYAKIGKTATERIFGPEKRTGGVIFPKI